MCLLVVVCLGVLPWAAGLSAWGLSGQLWLGCAAMGSGMYLGGSVVGSVSRYREDKENDHGCGRPDQGGS